MYKKICQFLDCQKLPYKHQYGFRAISTVYPVLEPLNQFSKNKKNIIYVNILYLKNLLKDFDVINHDILA